MKVGWPGPIGRAPILNTLAMSPPSVDCLMVESERSHFLDGRVPTACGQHARERIPIAPEVDAAAWLLACAGRASLADQGPPGVEERLQTRVQRVVGCPECVRVRKFDGFPRDEVARVKTRVDMMERDSLGRVLGVAPEIRVGAPVPGQEAHVQVDRSQARRGEDGRWQDEAVIVRDDDVRRPVCEESGVAPLCVEPDRLAEGAETFPHRLAVYVCAAEQQYLHALDHTC